MAIIHRPANLDDFPPCPEDARGPSHECAIPCPIGDNAKRRVRDCNRDCERAWSPDPNDPAVVARECDLNGGKKPWFSYHRRIVQQPRYHGLTCEQVPELRPRSHGCPPIDCQGEWDYSTREEVEEQCTGMGEERKRTFTVTTQPRDGSGLSYGETKLAKPCPSPLSETMRCPTDCVGAWKDVSPKPKCDRTTGEDIVISRFHVTTPAAHSTPFPGRRRLQGAPCQHTDGDTRTKSCPRDCQGQWVSQGNACAGKTDGELVASHKYQITVRAKDQDSADGGEKGKQCEDPLCEDRTNCKHNEERKQRCPTDCLGHWEKTTESCADPGSTNVDQWRKQIASHTYKITRDELSGFDGKRGSGCRDDECADQNDCKNDEKKFQLCPRDCLGSWDKTEEALESECTGDGGTRTRTYTITRELMNGGAPCEEKNNTQHSITCPTDCVGSWDYQNRTALLANECAPDTGTPNTKGFKKEVFRTYTIFRDAKDGGTPCDAGLDGEQAANNTRAFAYCPAVDCVGSWNATVADLCAGENIIARKSIALPCTGSMMQMQSCTTRVLRVTGIRMRDSSSF